VNQTINLKGKGKYKMDRIDVDKYAVLIGNDNNNKFIFKALRNGEEWIEDLTMTDGSSLIMQMAYEIESLRSKLESTNNIFIVESGMFNEGGSIDGVFDTFEKAEHYVIYEMDIKKYNRVDKFQWNRGCDYIEIIEQEVK
jgi:hypothetical protein